MCLNLSVWLDSKIVLDGTLNEFIEETGIRPSCLKFYWELKSFYYASNIQQKNQVDKTWLTIGASIISKRWDY